MQACPSDDQQHYRSGRRGVKAGVDTVALWECVRRGMVGRMHVLHSQVPQNVFRNDYETDTFPLKLLRKDVGLATALGRDLNVSLPLAHLAEQKLIEAVNRGWGDLSAYTVSFKLQDCRWSSCCRSIATPHGCW